MGGCIGLQRDRGTSSTVETSDIVSTHQVSVGKNQLLKHERLKWKSDVPLTDGQLRSKRDEFWDTAPAFDGRKEIWDALKAAAYAAECNDYTLAQAIIDGANISLPSGTLTDCYDELGNRYQLPVYCLSAPVNMIEENGDHDAISDAEQSATGAEVFIKVRLSTTGKDLKLSVRTSDTMAIAKRRLQVYENVDPARQRWFFSGKLLNDKLKIEEAKIPAGYVVQVVIAPEEIVSNTRCLVNRF
uniref:Ubiquitin-like domain-containing protein n=1 Tax=Strigamia maritima TaxID=126957 RepID=T1JHL7_STRMM